MRSSAIIFVLFAIALLATTACGTKEAAPENTNTGQNSNANVPATIDGQDTGVVAESDDVSVGEII